MPADRRERVRRTDATACPYRSCVRPLREHADAVPSPVISRSELPAVHAISRTRVERSVLRSTSTERDDERGPRARRPIFEITSPRSNALSRRREGAIASPLWAVSRAFARHACHRIARLRSVRERRRLARRPRSCSAARASIRPRRFSSTMPLSVAPHRRSASRRQLLSSAKLKECGTKNVDACDRRRVRALLHRRGRWTMVSDSTLPASCVHHVRDPGPIVVRTTGMVR